MSQRVYCVNGVLNIAKPFGEGEISSKHFRYAEFAEKLKAAHLPENEKLVGQDPIVSLLEEYCGPIWFPRVLSSIFNAHLSNRPSLERCADCATCLECPWHSVKEASGAKAPFTNEPVCLTQVFVNIKLFFIFFDICQVCVDYVV